MMTHVGFGAMGIGTSSFRLFRSFRFTTVLLLGAIPWMLSTEMFFQSERTYASAVAIIVNWLSMFCIIMTFIPLFVSKNVRSDDSKPEQCFLLVLFGIIIISCICQH